MNTTELSALKSHYLVSWNRLFSNLLGWDQETLQQWVQSQGLLTELDDEDGGVYSEIPAYWVVTPYIKEKINPPLPYEKFEELHDRLFLVLGQGRPDFSQEMDWDRYKARLDAEIASCRKRGSDLGNGRGRRARIVSGDALPASH